MATKMEQRASRVAVGDIVPSFSLPCADGKPFDIGGDDAGGRFRLLLFLGRGGEAGKALQALAERSAALHKHDALLLVVADGAVPPVAMPQEAKLLRDPGQRIERAFRPEDHPADRPFLVVLCPNQHLFALHRELMGELGDALAAIGAEARHFRSCEGGRHPPILQVPRALSPDDCRALTERFNKEGLAYVEPGHGDKGLSQDYKMRILEYGRHDRIDHWVMNPATVAFINSRLQRRVLPEVRKAFGYEITRHEPYRITKYEGIRGGELHGHRDNSELRVAHRRFALSINLNSEAFEGGGVRFPEYGGQIYRPPSGTALLFSCSLLHEAMHVTKGQRYVLLGFMGGET
ncbi:MAG: 2OG-Fe(II) oxygenase [Alphaproteobacteria bacterium]